MQMKLAILSPVMKQNKR